VIKRKQKKRLAKHLVTFLKLWTYLFVKMMKMKSPFKHFKLPSKELWRKYMKKKFELKAIVILAKKS